MSRFRIATKAVFLTASLLFCAADAAAQDQFWDKPAAPKPKPERKPAAIARKPAVPAPAAEPKSADGKEGTSNGAEAAADDKGASASEQEVAFWNSVKDAKNPDELKAYLKRFPNGTFADLARIRLKDLEQAPRTAAAAPVPSVSSIPGAVVKEIQARLYNLNFNITRFDGAIDEDTDRAIKAWQRASGFAQTGKLTDEQLVRLRAIVPPSLWGALAHPTTGKAVTVTGRKSRQEAESAALTGCRALHGVACRTFAVPAPQCIALASYQGRINTGQNIISHFYARETAAVTATAKALSNCQADPKRSGNACSLIGIVCGSSAGGIATPPAAGSPPVLPARPVKGPGQDA